MLLAVSDIVDGQCGIGKFRGFRKETDGNFIKLAKNNGWGEVLSGRHHGGCNFVGTGFINTLLCKEMYKHMCKEFKLVFQTPPRNNRNSGHMFFYAMFDDDHLSTDIEGIEPNWPWETKES